jgi:hypothetical protein
MKTLECHSKGDKRFSALYAKVTLNILGQKETKTIEEWYQKSKYFGRDYFPCSTIKDAKNYQKKGLKPVGIWLGIEVYPVKYLTQWYKILWIKYFKENPALLQYARKYNKFNDPFAGKNTVNSQADVIKECAKKGLNSVLKDCKEFCDILNNQYNKIINSHTKESIEQSLIKRGSMVVNGHLRIIKMTKRLPKSEAIKELKKEYGLCGGTLNYKQNFLTNGLGILVRSYLNKNKYYHFTWNNMYDLYFNKYSKNKPYVTASILGTGFKGLYGIEYKDNDKYIKLYNTLGKVVCDLIKEYDIYEIATGSTTIDDFLMYSAGEKIKRSLKESNRKFYTTVFYPYDSFIDKFRLKKEFKKAKKVSIFCKENGINMLKNCDSSNAFVSNEKEFNKKEYKQKIIDYSDIVIALYSGSIKDITSNKKNKNVTDIKYLQHSYESNKRLVLINPETLEKKELIKNKI